MSEPNDRRDARLAQALKHMPDAHMQPGAPARAAVLQAAARALNPAAAAANNKPQVTPTRWWQTWLGQPGARRPWNTAFASLALAFFVTVLWYAQDLPQRADDDAASQPRATVPQAPTSTAPAEPVPKMAGAAPVRSESVERKRAPGPARSAERVGTERESKALARETTVASAASNQAAAETASSTAAPAVASMTIAPAAPAARSLARADAVPEQRAHAGLSANQASVAGAVAAPPVTITQGGGLARVSEQAAQPLLALLGALSYEPASVSALAPFALAKSSAESGVQSGANSLTVEMAGRQRWVITGDQVLRERLGDQPADALGDAVNAAGLARLSAVQSAELRRVAQDIAARSR